MNNFFKQLSLLLCLVLFSVPQIGQSQTCNGLVMDRETNEKLPFVHIGVKGKNIGVISDDKGQFKLDLSRVDNDESISFSIIGYKTTHLSKSSALKENLIVKLKPISYELKEIVVKGKEQKEIKIGRIKTTKTTTGQSGVDKFGYGGEWGVKIKYPGESYYLKDVNFHTRFNTVDSVLYRINVYKLDQDLPGKSILQKEVFTKSYRKDKWISSSILSQNLIIEEDIIVTFELVQIWYRSKGENQLFYTHGKGYDEGMSFSKDSSFDNWKVNERAPIAMYVTGILAK